MVGVVEFGADVAVVKPGGCLVFRGDLGRLGLYIGYHAGDCSGWTCFGGIGGRT